MINIFKNIKEIENLKKRYLDIKNENDEKLVDTEIKNIIDQQKLSRMLTRV